jgi:spore germination protein KC
LKNRVIKILVLIICLTTVLTGCWDALDINDRFVCTTVVVDKKDDEYGFIVEIANIIPQDSNEDKYTTIRAYGESFASTRDKLDFKIPKPLFLGTVSVLVFTEEMAKDGIEEYMYRLRNLHEYRKTLNVVTTSQEPFEMLSLNSKREMSSGDNIQTLIDTLCNSGRSVHVSASEVLEFLSCDNDCFLLPNIEVDDEKFYLDGYSIIYQSVMYGYIPIKDSIGTTMILSDESKKIDMIIPIDFEGKRTSIQVKIKNKKIKPKYDNNQISFDVEFKFEGKVLYLDDHIIYDEKINERVNEKLIVYLRNELEAAADMSLNNFGCDYLGLYDYFRIKFPNETDEMDWYEEYPKCNVNIDLDCELDPGGEFDYEAEIE